MQERSPRRVAIVMAWCGKGIGWLFDAVTPTFNRRIPHNINYYVKGWAVVVVFTCLINAAASLWRGTFFPDGNDFTKQFLEDWPDLLNYLVLCPLYVLIALQFVTHAARLDIELAPVWTVLSGKPSKIAEASSVHIIGIAVLSMAISILFITKYMREFLSYRSTYWPISVGDNGVRTLGSHGIYYASLNVVLNLFMVVPGLYHFRMLRVAHRFGSLAQSTSSLSSGNLSNSLDSEDRARAALKPLSDTLALSKALIAVFMLNAITWSRNEPEAHGTLDITVLALLFLGIGLFAYPRYHIQYWLYRKWNTDKSAKYPDIRQPLAAGVNALADSIMLGTAAVALFLETILRRSQIQPPTWLREAIKEFMRKLTE